MLEAVLFVVRLPLYRFTVPLPERFNPPLRLMKPPKPAVMVPWQLTGSPIVPQPAKPWPAATVNAVPAVWVMPLLL